MVIETRLRSTALQILLIPIKTLLILIHRIKQDKKSMVVVNVGKHHKITTSLIMETHKIGRITTILTTLMLILGTTALTIMALTLIPYKITRILTIIQIEIYLIKIYIQPKLIPINTKAITIIIIKIVKIIIS